MRISTSRPPHAGQAGPQAGGGGVGFWLAWVSEPITGSFSFMEKIRSAVFTREAVRSVRGKNEKSSRDCSPRRRKGRPRQDFFNAKSARNAKEEQKRYEFELISFQPGIFPWFSLCVFAVKNLSPLSLSFLSVSSVCMC